MTGRIALITGASRGVGRGIALRLAADGAAVAANYRREAEAAAEVVGEITAKGGRAVAYGASVTDPDAVAAMLVGVQEDLGMASRGSRVADTTTSEYQRLLDVHLLGPLALIRALLPGTRVASRADIMVVSSTTASEVPPGAASYALANTAMEAATLTLAREERSHGLRVNILRPGLVATDMGRRLGAAAAGSTIEAIESSYPFGRVARPGDVAGAVAFLASRDAEYLTGQILEIDGGGPDTSLFH